MYTLKNFKYTKIFKKMKMLITPYSTFQVCVCVYIYWYSLSSFSHLNLKFFSEFKYMNMK